MSGKEGKRSKGRRNLYSHSKSASNAASSVAAGGAIGGATSTPFQPFGSGVTMNVNDVATEFGLTLKSSHEDAERITELMDAPVDLDTPAHAINRGPNPYLDRCMYCNTPRTDSQDGDEGLELLDLQLDGNTVINSLANPQSFSSLKLEIWTCANCRKVAGNFQSFLEANFPQASYDMPFLHDKNCADPLSCQRCEEERDRHERETQELQENWVELRSIVKDLYSTQEEPVLHQDQGERLKFLVDKLCSRDPHQLFLRLESQVREIVMEIKTSLLEKLNENGHDTPEKALDFTSSLLSHYDLLTKKAHLLAQYLGGLSEHLRRFKVTWELLNKHLFHSIAHNDPAISSIGPTILEQLRQGSVQFERSKDDPYCSVRKRLLKFQEEMSVVVVVWRDCQQLIENYCQEEVKNTQKQVSSKARSFISQQRQFLKQHLMKEPLMDVAMKNLMSSHKSSTERILCHRCKRERCTCDECTITHMITCGIINSDRGEIPPPPNSFNFALDHTRNVMDITPPSMSSTTSSSGSVSPINLEDKLTTFYDCERVLKEEFSDALLNCDERLSKSQSQNGTSSDDIDDNAGDDEEEEDDDDDDVDEDDFPDSQDAGSDEPHALQIPICELKDADALWEAVQQHQQQQKLLHQQQLLQQQQQQLFCDRLNQHSCSHCHHTDQEQNVSPIQHNCVHCHQMKKDQPCPFQPKIDPELSRQLDAEIAKSSLLAAGAGDCGGDTVAGGGDSATTNGGSGDSNGIANPGLCATCQCHACLKQSGHVISTSLPLQMPVSPPPAELHLYPHIHGLPQQHQQRYMLDLQSPLMPSIKLPVKLDFDDPGVMQDHLYHAYSDWDNTMQPRPGSLAAQHHHQHHQRLSALSSDLLPPPPLVTSAPPFTFDLASHLATHTTHTSTTNTTSAFKSVAGKHLASAILPTLHNVTNMATDGSSVDPTKPLDFESLAKIPQSCLNLTSSASPSSLAPSFSCASSTSTSVPGVATSGSCHGPPCSRPVPVGGNVAASKWEKHCKKFSGPSLLNKQMAGTQGQHPPHNLGVLPFTGGLQQAPPQAALKNLFPGHHQRSNLPCSHASSPSSRPGLSSHPAPPAATCTSSLVTTGSPNVSLACSNSLSTMVNNIGVGTSTPCTDPDCEAHHHDDNCDSVDDSCSEKSSSTSTSNQKEGKYCDCCYCEFFGHNNTQVAKTSTNYIEMKDRLRKKLKKRQNEIKHKQVVPKNGIVQETTKEDLKDPLEKKGLEGLLNFINGKDEDTQNKVKEKEMSAKALKRARQKQKKQEEKAKQEKNHSPNDKHHQPEKTLRQLLLNQALSLGGQPGLELKENMTKPKSKKSQLISGRKDSQEDRSVRRDEAPSPSKQEINRSSLIIESTRPTISLSNKDPDKFTPQQRLLAGNNTKETSQQMIHFLDALQTLKQHQQQQQNKNNKTPNPSRFVNSNSNSTSPAKSNGTVSSVPPKTSSEGSKPNGTAKQQQSQSQQPQRQRQVPSSKAVNGKVPAANPTSGTTNHLTNGKGPSNEKKVQSQQHVANGWPAKSQSTTTATSTPVTSTAAMAVSSVSSQKSLADSPSTGSGSSASQSPSCGTKPTADQGRTNGKTKKNKKKNKNGDISCVDEIFMPKSESELDGDVDEFERELEEFKRFCFEPAEPKERRKIAVNVNLKDIFKKKSGLV